VVFRAVVFKLLVWCGAEGYVSGLQDASLYILTTMHGQNHIKSEGKCSLLRPRRKLEYNSKSRSRGVYYWCVVEVFG